MSAALDPSAVRTGRVRGRYFRENFAQGGLELVQMIPELVTNADAAIEASGRSHGRIRLAFGEPDPRFARAWREQTHRLRVPALRAWAHELRCSDDGVGVDTATIDARLGALGVAPDPAGQRGLFGRGLRDVWMAQGAGRIEGVRVGRAVESWFFPARGDDPYVFVQRPRGPGHAGGPPATRRRGIGHARDRSTRGHTDAHTEPPADVGWPARSAAPDPRGPTPDRKGLQPGDQPADRAPALEAAAGPGQTRPDGPVPWPAVDDHVTSAALRFKRSPIRLHPGEQRGASLLVDPERVPPGTPIEIACDRGLSWKPPGDPVVPDPQQAGWSRLSGLVRARVATEPGSRLSVNVQAAGHTAVLEVLIVRHRAGGWVREIARKDEDAEVEPEFDPETGIATVYEGRREFRVLERAARRAGLSKRRVREYMPYRMLEVEVAANAVYAWAAREIIARRVGEHGTDGPAYAEAIRLEAQALRYRAHDRLMLAFLEPEVFDGGVYIRRSREDASQPSLLDGA